jgi:hypothetical protein
MSRGRRAGRAALNEVVAGEGRERRLKDVICEMGMRRYEPLGKEEEVAVVEVRGLGDV